MTAEVEAPLCASEVVTLRVVRRTVLQPRHMHPQEIVPEQVATLRFQIRVEALASTRQIIGVYRVHEKADDLVEGFGRNR